MLNAPLLILEAVSGNDHFEIIEYNSGFLTLLHPDKVVDPIKLKAIPAALRKEIVEAAQNGFSYYSDIESQKYYRLTGTGIEKSKCVILFTEERHKIITGMPNDELAFLRVITENSSDGFWMMDNALNTIFLSPSIKNQMGYTVEEYMSMPVTKRLPAVSLPIMQKSLQTLLDNFKKDPSNNSIIFEIPHLHKEGHIMWGEVNVKVLHDKENNILGFIGITRNVDERHSLQEKLEESEKLFRNLTENSPSAIFIYQGNKMCYANSATEKLTGYSSEELLQMNFWETVSPEHKEMVMKRGQQRLRGEQIENNYEFSIVTKQGELKWVDFTGTLTTYNGKPAAIGNIIDITHIKQTEFALRSNEEKLSNLFELAVDGIVTGDTHGNITRFNSRAEEITGLNRHKVMGLPISKLFPKETLDKTPLRFDLLNEGKMLVNQRIILKPDGTDVIVEMHSRRMPDMTYQAFIRDITERVRTEKDLEINREKFTTVFEKTQNPILIIDDKGNYIDSNNAGLAFLETDRERLLKMHVRDFLPDDIDESNFLEKHKELWIKGGISETPFKINGKLKMLLLSITPSMYDNKKHIYGIGTDITEQIKYLRALSESEEKFRHMSDNIADGITIIDDHKVIYTNRRLSEITGFSPEELVSMRGLDMAAPWEKERLKELYTKSQSSRKKIIELEFCFFSKSGEEKYLYNRYTHSKTNPTRKYIITTDITERKKIESELVTKNNEYKNLNIELNKAIIKAQESDKLKSAFMANMSHEIRTPLNAIMGFSEMLKKKNLPFEKVESYATVINQGGSHLLNLINDIIDFSKIDAGQMVLYNDTVNLNVLFKETYRFFEHTAKKKGLELHLEIPDKNTSISADETKIKQILNNLISNAIKFTEYGEVRFGYFAEESRIKLFVKDTGIGIKKEEIPLIFERFRQLETGQNSNFPGTGLGLSIVNGLVSLMKGKIKVQSTLFRGSVFEITLPFDLPGNNSIDETGMSKQYNEVDLSEFTLVLAEDESLSRLLVHEILQPTGISIVDAKDGEEAIEKTLKKKANIVLMDMGLPKIDGYKASQEIRKLLPNIPIIACSAYAFGSDKEKALKSGCNDFITKPYQMEQLIAIVSQYLMIKTKN